MDIVPKTTCEEWRGTVKEKTERNKNRGKQGGVEQ